MIDFNEMNEKYIVRYDESKSCIFAYLWSKRIGLAIKMGKKVCGMVTLVGFP